MKLNVYKSAEELNDGLAAWICDLINSTLQNQEFFTLALSGGNTPKMLYRKLASPGFLKKINWERVHIFWGDERAVSADDDRNNSTMAYKNLLNYTGIPESQIHKMRVDIMPVFAAKDYEHVLHTYFDNTENSFDLVLLGVGDDGHTLSLFPGSGDLEESKPWVNAVYNLKQHMYRLTLMPSIVNKASNIAFMVTGENKSEIVQRVIEGPYDPETLPAQVINPIGGELYWYLDEAAAKQLIR